MSQAKRLRRQLSPPEAKLWRLLRGSPAGIRFQRQYAVGPYIADFYCSAARLIIEVDGAIHDYRVEHDERRDVYLRGLGLDIVHIAGAEVMKDASAVAEALVLLYGAGPSTSFAGPPPHAGGAGRIEGKGTGG